MRYKKTVSVNGTETAIYDYVYSDGTLILLTHTANGVSNTARFVYDSFGEPRGFILNNEKVYLYLKNGQGDITAIVGEDGEILVRYEYNAWGAVEFIVPFGVDPALTTILATVSPFTYRGYCYDYDIGMYYLQSRYYDPQICRFINADSTNYLGATGTVLSYNLFAYCENDGVDRVDENGNYSAKKALDYAKTWWNDYNSFYKKNTLDCANFVSQCLYAGKMALMTGVGKFGWHHYIIATQPIYNSWGCVIAHYPIAWQVSDAWGKASKLYTYLKKSQKFSTRKIETAQELESVISNKNVSKGDVAFFANGSNIYHAVIIGSIVNTKKKKDIYFFAHTHPRNGYDTSSKNSYGFKKVIASGKNIYIVRIK